MLAAQACLSCGSCCSFGFGKNGSIAFMRRSCENGFFKYSVAPRLVASTIVSVLVSALSMITGIHCHSGVVLMIRNSSRPKRDGSEISRRTMSGGLVVSVNRRAFQPSGACLTA